MSTDNRESTIFFRGIFNQEIAFGFLTLHGTTAGEVKSRRRAVSTRWLGDDVTYCERQVETSPPYPDLGLNPGDRMRTDWFSVLWQRQ